MGVDGRSARHPAAVADIELIERQHYYSPRKARRTASLAASVAAGASPTTTPNWGR